jgi:hypothetical protein
MNNAKRRQLHRALDAALDAAPDQDERVYKVTASEEFLNRLDKHMAFIAWLGNVGHSCVAGISVDGDGSDRPKIDVPSVKIKENEVVTRDGPYEQLK